MIEPNEASAPIYKAGALLSKVLMIARAMCLSAAEERRKLLVKGDELVKSLRDLNTQSFKTSAFINNALDDLQSELQCLSVLDEGTVTASKDNKCPVCACELTTIGAIGPLPESKYCRRFQPWNRI
jgi:hypothetical protein